MKSKFLIVIGIMVMAAGSSLIHNPAHGLWIPQSPDDLLKQSQTIFVGNITSIKVLEFPKSSVYQTEENGIERQIIENYTLSLNEYTVNVEQFLKNPQNSHAMIVRQPTTSVPGMVVPIGGFNVGDRVLFYVEKIDDENTYSPESFEIPTFCDASSMLSKPRFAFGSDMKVMQNGIQMNDNFTAGIPIQFVYGNDVRTLEGKGYDIDVGINKIIDNKATPIFREKIRADAKPCEWIASAEWTITPQAGKHSMAFTIYDDDGDTFSHRGSFFVKDDTLETVSPLGQLYSGTSPDEISCKAGLTLVQKKSGLPACVTSETREKLIQRGWAVDFPMKYIIDDRYWSTTYLVHHTMCAHIGVEKISEEEIMHRFFWTMTDDDLEKIPIIKSMLEYNSHGLYSSDEYPITSTVVPDDIQNQYVQIFEELASDDLGSWRTFLYDGKYYATIFSIC